MRILLYCQEVLEVRSELKHTDRIRRELARIAKRMTSNEKVLGRLKDLEVSYEAARNSLAGLVPAVITPSPRMLTIAITAKCNFRCVGCRYGRDYMVGSELPADKVIEVLRDASDAGVSTVRLYGGEPLLHRELPKMIRECCTLGITPFISTNGFLLNRRINELVEAGLRIVSFGYYGSGSTYDSYVGRPDAWTTFRRSISEVRRRFGNRIQMSISYVLNTRTCSLEELDSAWSLAKEFSLRFHVDLVHYSLPYFTEGPNRSLQFREKDRHRIDEFVRSLISARIERPDLYRESLPSIRSIPDWLLLGPNMRVPCDAYNMIWVGADGSTRLCFADFPLGDVLETPLREMLFTKEHKRACVDAFALKCAHCHCGRDSRISKHIPSRARYAMGLPGSASPPTASQFPIIYPTP